MAVVQPVLVTAALARRRQWGVFQKKERGDLEHGDGAGDDAGSGEAHHADHSEAAVVELLVLKGSELGAVHELGGVDHGRVSLRAGLGVVWLDELAHNLHHGDGATDLELALLGDGLPGVAGRHLGEVGEGHVVRELAGEVHAEAVHAPAHEREHGHAGVLKLGGAEPEHGLGGDLLAVAHGVEVAHGGRDAGHVLHRRRLERSGAGSRDRGYEGRGGTHAECDDESGDASHGA
mmetsp:Transcript_2533/g.5543  ORF Transcript_2533/g.5543 Transcript_2533/m.5543 type:complete len:234 (+) Transcript_2533:155-856(+)